MRFGEPGTEEPVKPRRHLRSDGDEPRCPADGRRAPRGRGSVRVLQAGRTLPDDRGPGRSRPARGGRRPGRPLAPRAGLDHAILLGSARSPSRTGTSFRPAHPLLERLTTWKDLADARRFETLFSRILDDSGVVLRELLFKDDERALTNYFHLFEILLEAGPRHRLRPGRAGRDARRLYRRDAQAGRRGRQRPAAGERPRGGAGHDHPQEQGAGGRRRLRLRRFHRAVRPIGTSSTTMATSACSTSTRRTMEKGRGRARAQGGRATALLRGPHPGQGPALPAVRAARALVAILEGGLPARQRPAGSACWAGPRPPDSSRPGRSVTSRSAGSGRPDRRHCTCRRPGGPSRRNFEVADRSGEASPAFASATAGTIVTSYSRMKQAGNSGDTPIEPDEFYREPVPAIDPDHAARRRSSPAAGRPERCSTRSSRTVPFDETAAAADLDTWRTLDSVSRVVDEALTTERHRPRTSAARSRRSSIAHSRPRFRWRREVDPWPLPLHSRSFARWSSCSRSRRSIHPRLGNPIAGEAPDRARIRQGLRRPRRRARGPGLRRRLEERRPRFVRPRSGRRSTSPTTTTSRRSSTPWRWSRRWASTPRPRTRQRFGGMIYVFLRGLRAAGGRWRGSALCPAPRGAKFLSMKMIDRTTATSPRGGTR